MGKSGVKLSSLALIDLEEDKSFMSYETWVLSGKPTLDKAHKTIQECGKSTVECLGVVKSSIGINSQHVEGEFLVMGSKHLRTDLVLGKQLAKLALELQKSQKVLEQGKTAHIQESHQLQTETGDCIGSLRANSMPHPNWWKSRVVQTKLDKTKVRHNKSKTIVLPSWITNKGAQEQSKLQSKFLKPPKSTTDITRDVNHKGKAKVEEDIPRTSQNALKPQLDKGKEKLEETSEKPLIVSIQKPEEPIKSLKKSNKVSFKPAAQLRKPQWKWVPKHSSKVETRDHDSP